MLQFNKEGEKMKINEELFDYFKQVGTIKHYQKNEIIYMQDDCADELCLVLKGRVRVYHIKKNGDEIWVSQKVTIKRDENDVVSGFSCIIRDITNTKLIELEEHKRIEEISC